MVFIVVKSSESLMMEPPREPIYNEKLFEHTLCKKTKDQLSNFGFANGNYRPRPFLKSVREPEGGSGSISASAKTGRVFKTVSNA